MKHVVHKPLQTNCFPCEQFLSQWMSFWRERGRTHFFLVSRQIIVYLWARSIDAHSLRALKVQARPEATQHHTFNPRVAEKSIITRLTRALDSEWACCVPPSPVPCHSMSLDVTLLVNTINVAITLRHRQHASKHRTRARYRHTLPQLSDQSRHHETGDSNRGWISL